MLFGNDAISKEHSLCLWGMLLELVGILASVKNSLDV